MDIEKKLLAYAKKNKLGFTVKIENGKLVPVTGTQKERYSVAGDTAIVYTPKEKNIQYHAPIKDNSYMGGWFDKETGKYLIEHVNLYSNQKHALTVAKKRKQKAIFDLMKLNEIKVRYPKTMHISGMRIKTVSKKKMGEYTALHGKLPKNELPKNLKNIPKKDVLIRGNIKGKRRKEILEHEKIELGLMKKGMTYKKAHRKTERIMRARKHRPVVTHKGKKYYNRLTGKYVSKETAKRLNDYFKKHPGGTLYQAQRRPIYKKKVYWGKQPKAIRNLYKRKTQIVKTKNIHGKEVYFSPSQNKKVSKKEVKETLKLDFTEGIFRVQLYRMTTNKQRVYHIIKTYIGTTLKESDDVDELERTLQKDWMLPAMSITERIAKEHPIAKNMTMQIAFNHDTYITSVGAKDNGSIVIMHGRDPKTDMSLLPHELKKGMSDYRSLLLKYSILYVKDVTIFMSSNRPSEKAIMVGKHRLGVLNRNGYV